MSSFLLRLMLALSFAALTVVLTFIPVPIPCLLLSGEEIPGIDVLWQNDYWGVGLYQSGLQILSVIASGLLLGPGLALLSQVFYVTLGLGGWPVFYSGGGALYWSNPMIGYVVAFIPVAFIVGWLSYDRRKSSQLLISSLIGLFVFHSVGFLTLLRQSTMGVWELFSLYLVLPIFGQFAAITVLSLICTWIPPVATSALIGRSIAKEDESN